MKKFISAILLAMSLMMALSMNLQAKEWYEQATLHDATMKQWCKADNKSKLATAGNFVAVGYKDKLFKPEIIDAIDKSGMDGIKLMAQQVVNGLDKASCDGKKATPESSNQSVEDVAVMLIALMQWLK
ncbi:Uncharacterised protein [Actinobacillus lignieresii]|uniref:hypothetical protein n=1 Tax=Actinobacillus lignieresii TaxID=720 RepID=UPI000F716253|nr:hypothetical protein [Actinobacillus lignieresii]VEB25884.1 Uncharacterised protein [Actinobacillus lignieresii]